MTKKKTPMQEQVKKDELQPDNTDVPKGDQMALMNVSPKKSKEIVRVAKAYHAKVRERLEIQKGRNGEDALQEKLLELVKAENLSRDNNGKIKFKVDGVELELVPTKEKVKVKVVEE